MKAPVRRALDEQWPSVYENARAQLGLIQQFASNPVAHATQRDAAYRAAHKLHGSLGMFGRRNASTLAAAIEQLLRIELTSTTALRELRTLIDQLDYQIDLSPLPAP